MFCKDALARDASAPDFVTPDLVTPNLVTLEGEVEAALLAAAHAAWPREAVLALVGRREEGHAVIEGCVLLQNIAPEDAVFVVDPIEFVRLEAGQRAAGRQWLGFAHSHPNGLAELSAQDRATLWPHCVQLVLGLRKGAPATLRAFWLDGAHMQAIPMRTLARGEVRA